MIHILTGEYPPVRGGVGDYTALVAAKLTEMGEPAHVWTAGHPQSGPLDVTTVHRVAGRFGPRGLFRLDRQWNALPPHRRVLVQWTPHSFGFRSLNMFFPLWLLKRALMNRDRIEVMVHEPFVAFQKGNLRRNLAATVHRVMIAILLRAASRVWVSIPEWESALRPWCFGRTARFTWLPVASNIDTRPDAATVQHFRASLTRRGTPVIGSFGTYRPDISNLLAPAIRRILETSEAVILLAGAHSEEFHAQLAALYPALRDRCVFTGELPARALAAFLSACDMLLQPYPDGISTRRGTAMAALALGLPVVTNLGALSEAFWPQSGAVALAASPDPDDLASAARELFADPHRRFRIAARGRELYSRHFDVNHAAAALLGRPQPAGSIQKQAVA